MVYNPPDDDAPDPGGGDEPLFSITGAVGDVPLPGEKTDASDDGPRILDVTDDRRRVDTHADVDESQPADFETQTDDSGPSTKALLAGLAIAGAAYAYARGDN